MGDTGAISLSNALKSNTTLTTLIFSCDNKRSNTHKWNPSIAHYSLFIKQIGNNVGDIGVKSLSDALKRNTTLLKLDLSGEDKKKAQHTNDISINNPLFSILIKSTVNNIEERGATSLSDALKSNTTLIELNLRSKDKRNKKTPIYIGCFPFSSNQQKT